jgi:CRP/FNR family transcriptional regulator, anaerobic regulatory protein
MSELQNYFPIWNKLTETEQALLLKNARLEKAEKGKIIREGSTCVGLLVITSGQLRAYITSAEGRQITIYRLLDYDICLFSASCMMKDIQFEITIEAEKESEFFVIPAPVYKELMNSSLVVANYTNQLLASRITEVMWLVDQVLFKSIDKRLASFLLEESNLEDTTTLEITHEKIASHIGSAREVITRMLKYFQAEKLVKLSRGSIELTDIERLSALVEH